MSGAGEPLPRLRISVEPLFEQSLPFPAAQRPLFSGFALHLLAKHPAQVATARLPLLNLFTELLEQAAEAGSVHADRPRRPAAPIMQTVMFSAQANGAPSDSHAHPVTADAVWQFCLGGISGA
jgi:hypothetical protein